MNPSALIFMSLSWLFVIVLNLFCFGRILTDRRNNRK